MRLHASVNAVNNKQILPSQVNSQVIVRHVSVSGPRAASLTPLV